MWHSSDVRPGNQAFSTLQVFRLCERPAGTFYPLVRNVLCQCPAQTGLCLLIAFDILRKMYDHHALALRLPDLYGVRASACGIACRGGIQVAFRSRPEMLDPVVSAYKAYLPQDLLLSPSDPVVDHGFCDHGFDSCNPCHQVDQVRKTHCAACKIIFLNSGSFPIFTVLKKSRLWQE